MEKLERLLAAFKPISLHEMDAVSLMDRCDNKYQARESIMADMIEFLHPHYKILTINQHRIFTYETLYYDTDDYNLYLQHHNKKLARLKVRHRTYKETGTAFLEVKRKTNKGRTIKKRMACNDLPHLQNPEIMTFLAKFFPPDQKQLLPAIWVYFKRFTLVSNALNERVTIDTHLKFAMQDKEISMGDLVIIETKRDGKAEKSIIKSYLDAHKISEGSLSKYCLGTTLLQDGIKKNNFKALLSKIKTNYL